MSKVYDFRDYDKYLALKINAGLWLVIAYLLRPYIVLIASFRMGRGGGAGDSDLAAIKQLLYPDDFSLALGIVTTLPVLLLMFGYMKRKPSAGAFIRIIWRNGLRLLGLAVGLNVFIIFVPVLTGIASRVHLAGWIQIALSLVILGYLMNSQRIRDTFADFPVAGNA